MDLISKRERGRGRIEKFDGGIRIRMILSMIFEDGNILGIDQMAGQMNCFVGWSCFAEWQMN